MASPAVLMPRISSLADGYRSSAEDRLRRWCVSRLGSAPVEVFFVAQSMSQVRGVILGDGRRVALKLREASARVLACASAQRAAREAGIDCPGLVAGPDLLPTGVWVTAEEWRPEGLPEAPGDSAESYVALQHRLLAAVSATATASFDPPPPWAHYDHSDPGRVWPKAASPRWDPESAQVPAELRRLASAARERLMAERLPQVVGHTDLNGLNVRWAPHPIVHDWDSLAARPECVHAGILAVNHVELPGVGRITAVGDTERALDLYQRSRPFSQVETELAWAAGIWVAAYNAAFEYLHGSRGEVSTRLESDSSQRLRLAGCTP